MCREFEPQPGHITFVETGQEIISASKFLGEDVIFLFLETCDSGVLIVSIKIKGHIPRHFLALFIFARLFLTQHAGC